MEKHSTTSPTEVFIPFKTKPLQKKSAKSNDPLFIVKPKFVPIIAFLSGAIIPVIFFSGFGMMFFGNTFATTAAKLNLPVWFAYLFFGASFFMGSTILTFWVMAKMSDQCEYHFFQTRMDYYEGFITIKKGSVDYQDIKDISLENENAQHMCGLGTIVLAVDSASKHVTAEQGGIYLTYIDKADEAYDNIRYLINRSMLKSVTSAVKVPS